MLLIGVSFTMVHTRQAYSKDFHGASDSWSGGKSRTKKTTTKLSPHFTLLHCKLPSTLGKSLRSQNGEKKRERRIRTKQCPWVLNLFKLHSKSTSCLFLITDGLITGLQNVHEGERKSYVIFLKTATENPHPRFSPLFDLCLIFFLKELAWNKKERREKVMGVGGGEGGGPSFLECLNFCLFCNKEGCLKTQNRPWIKSNTNNLAKQLKVQIISLSKFFLLAMGVLV